jgi:hypothetical protein
MNMSAFQEEMLVGVHSEAGFQCAGSVLDVGSSAIFRWPS